MGFEVVLFQIQLRLQKYFFRKTRVLAALGCRTLEPSALGLNTVVFAFLPSDKQTHRHMVTQTHGHVPSNAL